MNIQPVEAPPPAKAGRPRVKQYDDMVEELKLYAGSWCRILEDVPRSTGEKWRRSLIGRGCEATTRKDAETGLVDVYAQYP